MFSEVSTALSAQSRLLLSARDLHVHGCILVEVFRRYRTNDCDGALTGELHASKVYLYLIREHDLTVKTIRPLPHFNDLCFCLYFRSFLLSACAMRRDVTGFKNSAVPSINQLFSVFPLRETDSVSIPDDKEVLSSAPVEPLPPRMAFPAGVIPLPVNWVSTVPCIAYHLVNTEKERDDTAYIARNWSEVLQPELFGE